jgi:hypothetical protein
MIGIRIRAANVSFQLRTFFLRQEPDLIVQDVTWQYPM